MYCDRQSLLSAVSAVFIRIFGPKREYTTVKNTNRLIKRQRRKHKKKYKVAFFWRTLIEMRRQTAGGMDFYTINPRAESKKHIIYIHGGGYIKQIMFMQWRLCCALARKLDCAVSVPIYPLAPENTYKKAFASMELMYKALLRNTDPADITISGDSAGGGFSVGFCMYLRDRGLPLPGNLVLISPWLDMTCSNPKMEKIDRTDVMTDIVGIRMVADLWAGDEDKRCPYLSPVYGDMKDIPPIYVFIGSNDILYPDSVNFYKKALEAGSPVELYDYKWQYHDFVLARFKEGRDAFSKISDIVSGKHSSKDPQPQYGKKSL